MGVCGLCNKQIDKGLLYGLKNESGIDATPICIKCLKRLIDSDGKDFGLKDRIERWLSEEGYSFTILNEPFHQFHFMIRDLGPMKMVIEIFQEKDQPNLIVGFMTFLSNEITFKMLKFSSRQKEDLKRKIDDFLATLRVDYRTGYRIGYELVNEKGHYGAKYFVRTKAADCTKESLFDIIELVLNTGQRADTFVNKEILS